MAYTSSTLEGQIFWSLYNTPKPQPVGNNYYITFNQPQAQPVSPTFDPKIEANTLYGKPMALAALGFARIGASPAPIVGPYLNAGNCDFIVSFGVAVPVDGDRKIYAIYLDNELAWSSVSGGTLPAHGTFAAEAFDFVFKPGTLTQTICSLESEKFPGDENAYRPQMLLEIRNLPYQRFLDRTGKPVPYVACDIGDVTDGADPDDGINVGLGWERIAHSPWAGYTAATAEYVGATDMAYGYLIKDNFTVVGLGQINTRTHKNLDLLQSDKLRLSDRGGNLEPDFVFDRDDIIGDVTPIQIARAGATAQRRELELVAIDPDQDYTPVPSLSKIPRDPFVISAAVGKETITSPLVLDAQTRQALVTYTQQYEENARKKIALKVRAIGYEIEPGDLFATLDIADQIDNEVWKVTQTVHGANFIVEIEAEAALKCSIFVEDVDLHFPDVVLLLHANGNDGSTSFVDSSQYAHTITVRGGAQVSATPKYGSGALLTDGTGDGLATAINTELGNASLSPTNTSPYTIECWAQFSSINRQQFLVGMDGGLGARVFRLWQNGDDELQFDYGDGSSFIGTVTTSGAAITVDSYIHCAVDKDSTGKIRIYVGGVMKGSDTPADSTIGLSNEKITVGISGLDLFSFDGLIDEVRITRGTSRYGDVAGDSSFTPPAAQFPDS